MIHPPSQAVRASKLNVWRRRSDRKLGHVRATYKMKTGRLVVWVADRDEEIVDMLEVDFLEAFRRSGKRKLRPPRSAIIPGDGAST